MGPAPGTTLQKLPVEVLAAILAGCPDIKTLKSAIKTCHAFQAVFLEAQCTLSLTVLLNELDEHSRFILPDIILATKAQMRHEARGGDPRRSVSTSGISNPSAGGIPEEVQRVHELFYQDRDHSAFMWTLEAAAVASELSASVKSVAGKITFMAVGHLESQKDGRASFPSAPRLKPSRYEIARIRRAVCRLATFNILFPNQRQWHHCSPGIKLAICVFLSAQSPWENEQLACVHNLLWCLGESSIFSNSFTSAILNPALSAPTTEFDDDIIHRHLHYELNNGLSSYGLVDEQLPIQSNTWAELRNLVRNAMNDHDPSLLAARRETLQSRIAEQPIPCDKLDRGPELAWRWPRAGALTFWPQLGCHLMDLRLCGYVFWDESRLKQVGLLEMWWRDVRIATASDLEFGRARFS